VNALVIGQHGDAGYLNHLILDPETRHPDQIVGGWIGVAGHARTVLSEGIVPHLFFSIPLPPRPSIHELEELNRVARVVADEHAMGPTGAVLSSAD
jgi:hypothetical protein